MPTLSYLKFAQLKSLLLVSVLPALSLACNHPSTGTGDGSGGRGDNGAGGSAAGHSGIGGANGSAGANGRAGSGAGGSSTASDGGADAVSSTGGSGPTRGPTPPAPGMKFPFPQNRQSANCVYPTGYTNDVVVAAYNKWKADTVTTAGAGGFRRVKRTQSDYTGTGGLELESTVSEGIGYGMLIAVYMNDQALFDDLWKYEQLWPNDKTGLMDWYINAAGTMRLGTGPATDADEDMAFALVMADRQWGGKGSLSSNYIDVAKDQISKIWNNEIYQSKLLLPGNWGDWSTVNISYFAPAYYRVFDNVDTDTDARLAGGDPDRLRHDHQHAQRDQQESEQRSGPRLVHQRRRAQRRRVRHGPADGADQLSVRFLPHAVPHRARLVLVRHHAARSDYAAKTSSFFSAIGAANIADGYNLDGTPSPQHAGQRSAAFIGPAGVGAMTSGTYQTLVDQSYATVAADNALAGGAYYEESWTVMSLLMMTGNFLDYTSY